MDKSSGGSVTRTVTYYPVAGAMRINSTLYYVLKDHLGSASVVTDASGNVVGDQRYYPFGETRLSTGTMGTDKLFTGQRAMEGLGIYHYGARFYLPSLGRFLSADTIIPGYMNPQSWNRFSYVLNNPIRFNDPTGHKACDGAGLKGACDQSGVPTTTSQIKVALKSYGVKTKGKWSNKDIHAALMGVELIGQKLAKAVGGSAKDAFKKTFTTVTFEWVDGVCGESTDRCYADANSFPNTIKFYSKHWAGLQDEQGNNIGNPIVLATPDVTSKLTIHELGHAFDVRTNRAFNQALVDEGITTKKGFGTIVGAGGQHEVTADLFTNWVLGTFTGPGEGDVNLPQFMDNNIATWVNIASMP